MSVEINTMCKIYLVYRLNQLQKICKLENTFRLMMHEVENNDHGRSQPFEKRGGEVKNRIFFKRGRSSKFWTFLP